MIALSPAPYLSDANREVQAADHVLSAVYPLTRDPKALVSVLTHETRALESAAHAVAIAHGKDGDLLHAFAAAASLPHAKDAQAVHDRLSRVLAKHGAASVVFTRGETRVIADEEFNALTTIDAASAARDLAVTKSFVHEANAHIALGR